jgi:choloylglycine hydrolase
MKLDLGADQSHTYSGNATAELKPSSLFSFWASKVWRA